MRYNISPPPEFGISSTYAYKLEDRAMEILRGNIGRPAGRPDAKTENLKKRVADLEQLAGDQTLAIRYLKPRLAVERTREDTKMSVTRLSQAFAEPRTLENQNINRTGP